MEFTYEEEKLPYVLHKVYWTDFVIYLPGHKLYVENKGYLRPSDKVKLLAIREQYPEIDLRILFYEHRKSQIQWATRHGFQWAVGQLPEEWLTCGQQSSC